MFQETLIPWVLGPSRPDKARGVDTGCPKQTSMEPQKGPLKEGSNLKRAPLRRTGTLGGLGSFPFMTHVSQMKGHVLVQPYENQIRELKLQTCAGPDTTFQKPHYTPIT